MGPPAAAMAEAENPGGGDLAWCWLGGDISAGGGDTEEEGWALALADSLALRSLG